MVFIVRELAKVIMFTVLWGIPVLLTHMNQSNYFLWFFIMSALFTVLLFEHYRELEKIDNHKCNCDKTNK